VHSQNSHTLPHRWFCHTVHSYPDLTLWALALAPGTTGAPYWSFLLAATCTVETSRHTRQQLKPRRHCQAGLPMVKATWPRQILTGTLVDITESASQPPLRLPNVRPGQCACTALAALRANITRHTLCYQHYHLMAISISNYEK
jgi:hypothetical protein